MSANPHGHMRWLHRFAWLLVATTFLLIVAGASVTSNRAGLAVPDWPESYGYSMWRFPLKFMRGGIFYEHTHRLIASFVGLLTTILAAWTFFRGDRIVRRLGLAALAMVLLQGLLGGLTVRFLLPPPISIAHAALAQAFFCVTVALALGTSGFRPVKSTNQTRGLSLALTIAVYLQLILGAAIRHSERGVIAHIVGAIAVVALAILVRRAKILALLGGQILLGLATLAVRQPKLASGQLDTVQILLPTLHLAVGALILGVSFALTFRLGWPKLAPVRAYVELTKPRIVTMVLVTTTLGFFLGGHAAWPLLLAALIGVGLATAGAAALNNYLDRDVDSKMSRTRNRALPTGLVSPAQALAFGVSLVLIGVLALVWAVNLLTGFLALLAAFLYVLVYTPMKRLSWLNTSIGAIPGAIPPLCGWAAASGQLAPGAWALFAILFVWQHPHFYSIAWMFRDDYKNADLKMLPVVDPPATFRQTILFSVALIVVAILPACLGMAGRVYLVGAVALSVAMLAVGISFCRKKSFTDARRLLKASVIYLPLLVILMLVGCGKSNEQQPAPTLPQAAETPAPAVEQAGTASITGKVTFKGDAPSRSPIKLSADPVCEAAHSGKVFTEDVLVNEDGTLRNVFVYIKQGAPSRKFMGVQPVVLDQNGCMYRPHVQGIQIGQPFVIRNSDDTLHNIHSLAEKNDAFNLGQPNRGMEAKKMFTKSEVMIHFKCDVHPWMSCYLGVLDHPFFSVTGDGGTFNLANLPAGDYLIEAWHEKYGTQQQKITLDKDETKTVAFEFASQP